MLIYLYIFHLYGYQDEVPLFFVKVLSKLVYCSLSHYFRLKNYDSDSNDIVRVLEEDDRDIDTDLCITMPTEHLRKRYR